MQEKAQAQFLLTGFNAACECAYRVYCAVLTVAPTETQISFPGWWNLA